jgi:hypothetical protein
MRMAADEFTSTRRVDPILSNDIITEDSAALTFVDQRGDVLRFCHSTGAWFKWNGVFWEKDDTGAPIIGRVRLLGSSPRSRTRKPGRLPARRPLQTASKSSPALINGSP